MDIIKSQAAHRNHHDQFHAQLEKAEDGFSIVAEYFGRGNILELHLTSLNPIIISGMFSDPVSVPELTKLAPLKPIASYQTITDSMTSLSVSEARLRTDARLVGILLI